MFHSSYRLLFTHVNILLFCRKHLTFSIEIFHRLIQRSVTVILMVIMLFKNHTAYEVGKLFVLHHVFM